MPAVRVLLTEGSSLTAREVLSCLGPCGYEIEVLDPAALCIARFSRWTRRVHRCPHASGDPLAYLRRLDEVARERKIDVILPTHEQAWLLAVGRPLLNASVRVALASPQAFARVQSKLAFARLLDELGLPQPAWRPVTQPSDVADLPFPYWLKSAFSTAGRGVREARDQRSRDQALRELLGAGGGEVMAQQPARGEYAQVQALFDRGRLLAAHTSAQTRVGVGGSAAARVAVEHPRAREHAAMLGRALDWHGGMTLDFDYLHEQGSPAFIECNPRTVEPGNATAAGVNLPVLQVRLTLGEELPSGAYGQAGARTHGTLALALGVAAAGGSRGALLGELRDALSRRGSYRASREQLTPLLHDPPSIVPLTVVLAQLLASPRRVERLAAGTVASYAVGEHAVELVAQQLADRASGSSERVHDPREWPR